MWNPLSILQRLRTKTAPHIATGKEGEDLAANYLRSLGYNIMGRNVRVGRRHEIDILAYDRSERVLVFAEIKSRSVFHEEYQPILNFTPTKQRKVERAARRWIAQRNYMNGYRIDLICIAGTRIVNHIKEIPWST